MGGWVAQGWSLQVGRPRRVIACGSPRLGRLRGPPWVGRPARVPSMLNLKFMRGGTGDYERPLDKYFELGAVDCGGLRRPLDVDLNDGRLTAGEGETAKSLRRRFGT